MKMINADFSKKVIIKPDDYAWLPSPNGEVERMMLDRIGDEKARATSLVKYAPKTVFPEHSHPLGEELFILSGTFTENGEQHYPRGWYIRNPHNSKHIPSSNEGALIFVKLMQMGENETEKLVIDTNNPDNWIVVEGRTICPLFSSLTENTYLEKLSAQDVLQQQSFSGLEILVIQGELLNDDDHYPEGTWIRYPADATHTLIASDAGAEIYIKSGHL